MHPCCGKSLRTGSLIVGAVELIFASISAIFYCLGLAAAGDYKNQNEIKRVLKNFRVPFFNLDVDHTAEEIASSLRAIFSVGLISCFLGMGLCVLLIIGAKRENLKLLKIWVIIRLVLISLALVYVFTVLVSGYSTASGFFIDISNVGLHVYFLWIVYSYWKQLEEEKSQKLSPSIVQTQGKIDVTFPL